MVTHLRRIIDLAVCGRGEEEEEEENDDGLRE